MSASPETLALANQEIAKLTADLARVTAQNRTLRESVCLMCKRSLAPDGDCHGCRADRADAALAACREALEQYGEHTVACKRTYYHPSADTVQCTCGLDAALHPTREAGNE